MRAHATTPLALALLLVLPLAGSSQPRRAPAVDLDWCEPRSQERCPAVFKLLVEQGMEREQWESLSDAQRGKLFDASMKQAGRREHEVRMDFERAQGGGRLDPAKEAAFKLWLGKDAVQALKHRAGDKAPAKPQGEARLKDVDAMTKGPDAGGATTRWMDSSRSHPVNPAHGAVGVAEAVAAGAPAPSPDAQRAAIAARGAAVPEVKLNALADVSVAPAPTLLDRAGALIASDGPVIKQDLAAIRARMQDFQNVPSTAGSNTAGTDAPQRFFDWLKTVKDEDLPKIKYDTLPEGKLAEYSKGVYTKSTLTINYAVMKERPEARSAALVHELYHYWDNDVAKNFYEDNTYGRIDDANLPNHEYDAYYVTAQYWKQAKPEGASGKLPAFLDKLPAEPGEVRTMVDDYYRSKKKR